MKVTAKILAAMISCYDHWWPDYCETVQKVVNRIPKKESHRDRRWFLIYSIGRHDGMKQKPPLHG